MREFDTNLYFFDVSDFLVFVLLLIVSMFLLFVVRGGKGEGGRVLGLGRKGCVWCGGTKGEGGGREERGGRREKEGVGKLVVS